MLVRVSRPEELRFEKGQRVQRSGGGEGLEEVGGRRGVKPVEVLRDGMG